MACDQKYHHFLGSLVPIRVRRLCPRLGVGGTPAYIMGGVRRLCPEPGVGYAGFVLRTKPVYPRPNKSFLLKKRLYRCTSHRWCQGASSAVQPKLRCDVFFALENSAPVSCFWNIYMREESLHNTSFPFIFQHCRVRHCKIPQVGNILLQKEADS